MRNKFIVLCFFVLSANIYFAFATVRGRQEIEFLGYSERDRKVYWLIYYYDETGRLPTLCYMDLSDKPFVGKVDSSWAKEIKSNDRKAFFRKWI